MNRKQCQLVIQNKFRSSRVVRDRSFVGGICTMLVADGGLGYNLY